MLETITLVGALVGLATAAFTVWDRWVVRGRPLARSYIKTFGDNPFKFIRIKNPGPDDVFITGVRAFPAGIYGVAKNDSIDAILQATVPRIFGVAGAADFWCRRSARSFAARRRMRSANLLPF